MKKTFIILLFICSSVKILSSQTLIQQIENAYNSLDSVSYLENVMLSYKEDLLKTRRGAEDAILELRGTYNNMDSAQRQKTLDSVMAKYGTTELSYREDFLKIKKKEWEKMSAARVRAYFYINDNIKNPVQRNRLSDSFRRESQKNWDDKAYTTFIFDLNNNHNPKYVLNVRICQDSDNQWYLCPDTTKLNFNIYFFGKLPYPEYYVFTDEGEIALSSKYYYARKAFMKIMKKQPKYLLRNVQVWGANSILYVLNDKIYVFVISEMREYELSDYLKKFSVEKLHFQLKECRSEHSNCAKIE